VEVEPLDQVEQELELLELQTQVAEAEDVLQIQVIQETVEQVALD
jgi:hypothetical protein